LGYRYAPIARIAKANGANVNLYDPLPCFACLPKSAAIKVDIGFVYYIIGRHGAGDADFVGQGAAAIVHYYTEGIDA
jgi:hypothetical protein